MQLTIQRQKVMKTRKKKGIRTEQILNTAIVCSVAFRSLMSSFVFVVQFFCVNNIIVKTKYLFPEMFVRCTCVSHNNNNNFRSRIQNLWHTLTHSFQSFSIATSTIDGTVDGWMDGWMAANVSTTNFHFCHCQSEMMFLAFFFHFVRGASSIHGNGPIENWKVQWTTSNRINLYASNASWTDATHQ